MVQDLFRELCNDKGEITVIQILSDKTSQKAINVHTYTYILVNILNTYKVRGNFSSVYYN